MKKISDEPVCFKEKPENQAIVSEKSKGSEKMQEKIEGLEFWDKERFKNRSLNIMGGFEAISIPVPDDVVICDFCNAQITEFPVPVYLGSALCPKCLAELKEDIKKEKKDGL